MNISDIGNNNITTASANVVSGHSGEDISQDSKPPDNIFNLANWYNGNYPQLIR